MMGTAGILASSGLGSPLDIAAVKSWHDTTLRSSRKQGDPFPASEDTDASSNVWRIDNLAAGPKLAQMTNALGLITTGSTTLVNSFSASRWMSAVQNSENASALPTSTTEGWMFAYVNATYQDANGQRVAVAYGSTGGTGARILGFAASGVGSTDLCYPMISIDGSSYSSAVSLSTDYRNTAMLLAGRFSTTQLELWINGTSVGTPSTTDPATGTTDMSLCAGPSSSTERFNGAIGNIIVTTALTTLERQFIEGFICWKHGIASSLPGGHPYKTSM